MPTPDELTAGYQQAVQLLRVRLNQLAMASWDRLGSYRDADIDRLIAALVPRVQSGQLLVARLTATYLEQMLGQLTTTGDVDEESILNARGVPAEEVYRRPANQVYTALAAGKPFDAALALGRDRLASLVATDLQMAKVRQADATLLRNDVQYYRRVLRGAGNCAKCVITSTRRYRTGRLMPIHPGCDCGVAPIRGNAPLVLDQKLLDATHEQVAKFAEIENANAEGYQNLIVTHEHGEIGPVLGWRGQNFRGPDDL